MCKRETKQDDTSKPLSHLRDIVNSDSMIQSQSRSGFSHRFSIPSADTTIIVIPHRKVVDGEAQPIYVLENGVRRDLPLETDVLDVHRDAIRLRMQSVMPTPTLTVRGVQLLRDAANANTPNDLCATCGIETTGLQRAKHDIVHELIASINKGFCTSCGHTLRYYGHDNTIACVHCSKLHVSRIGTDMETKFEYNRIDGYKETPE